MKPNPLVRRIVRETLREDLGARGDVTSLATIPATSRSKARMVAKSRGILSGISIAVETFRQAGPRLKIRARAKDGTRVRRGQVVLEVAGSTRAILAAERAALNFVQQLSGVATLTRAFVDAAGKRAQILDTRKTVPLLREFQKYAVHCGGGSNHRFGLHDMVLIKDNHLAALAGSPNPVGEAVRRARKRWPKLKIEVECDTLEQVRRAVAAKADIILLDNMKPSQLKKAVRMVKGRCKTEASGGVDLKTVRAIARTGVDFVSVGALTHSAPALDFSLEVVPFANDFAKSGIRGMVTAWMRALWPTRNASPAKAASRR